MYCHNDHGFATSCGFGSRTLFVRASFFGYDLCKCVHLWSAMKNSKINTYIIQKQRCMVSSKDRAIVCCMLGTQMQVALTSFILPIFKGQLISKWFLAFWGHRFPPKNERINSFSLVCDMFSFVFCRKSTTSKNLFKIN